MDRHVVRQKKEKNSKEVSIKPEAQTPLERYKCGLLSCGSEKEQVKRSCEHSNEHSISVICGDVLISGAITGFGMSYSDRKPSYNT
jgi:hypothetical protein